MLTTPARPSSLSRNQSFENPPCPPYNLSQEDVLAQAPITEEDDLWVELERTQDPGILKEKFYAEHQLMREQLNLAGRFGLELQHSLEQAQRAERESYAQIQALQDENLILQSRVNHTQALSAHLVGSEDEVKNLTNENESLQKELDGCRRELKTFRKELDNLVEQMSEMGTEVMDAKTKVSVYSRRLNEVEQELTSTQELNVNLQEQLHAALEKHKQTQSNTAQVVKNMQNELGRVVSDSGAIRSTLEVLENRQEKCEGQVVEMISNTKEYAQLLEEAQTTIQTMRIESDMDGRWNLSPTSSSWDHQLRNSTKQLSTLAMEDPELKPQVLHDEELDPQSWDESPAVAPGMSLGMELGLEGPLDKGEWDNDHSVTDRQPKETIVSSPPSTPASPHIHDSSKQPTPAPSPRAPAPAVHHKETQTPVPQQQPTHPIRKDTSSLSTELHQRLEEHNNLQMASSSTSSRPPWNPSVALENVLTTPTRNRSRSISRGPSSSSRGSSRSVSQASFNRLVSTGRAPLNPIPSPQTSPHMMASSTNSLGNDTRPRSRTTPSTTEKNSMPGQTSTGSNTNTITKTKASKSGSVSSISSSTTRGTKNTDSSTRRVSESSSNNKAVGRIISSTSSSSLSGNSTKSSASVTTEGASKSRIIKKKVSSASLATSPSTMTVTTATGQTTPHSHPLSPISSPAPLSPSIASKKLKAISGSGSGSGTSNGTSSRRPSVTSAPLPLPVSSVEIQQ
ncbi:hypothetical protein BGZ46_009344 [Entomortierella lignicola]|nr:hypothetical protein BGZ46_009344 [Entomortierella lignicola]